MNSTWFMVSLVQYIKRGFEILPLYNAQMNLQIFNFTNEQIKFFGQHNSYLMGGTISDLCHRKFM